MNKLKYEDITGKILHAAFEVHSFLGNGFQEVIYQRGALQLEDVHFAQALNYLKIYRLEVGLLINFGSKSLTFKRLIRLNPKITI